MVTQANMKISQMLHIQNVTYPIYTYNKIYKTKYIYYYYEYNIFIKQIHV